MKKVVWELSVKNSLIHFKVKYLRISNITGQFLKFKGEVIADEFFNHPQVHLFIDANSVGAIQHPVIEFNSVDGCRQSSGKIWELTGNVVANEMKSPLTLVVNFSDIKEGRRKPTANFHLFGKISRKRIGLVCTDEEDVSDELNIYAEIFLTMRPGSIDIS